MNTFEMGHSTRKAVATGNKIPTRAKNIFYILDKTAHLPVAQSTMLNSMTCAHFRRRAHPANNHNINTLASPRWPTPLLYVVIMPKMPSPFLCTWAYHLGGRPEGQQRLRLCPISCHSPRYLLVEGL